MAASSALATSTQPIEPALLTRPTAERPGAPSAAWLRAIQPSFSDAFFIALLVWLFMCGDGGWKSLLGDGDTGWHIRTGEYILQHHAVPHQDLFSFSKPGAPWFAWEWLTDIIYAALFHVAGLKGIVLLSGVLIAACGTVILRYSLWRGANGLVGLTCSLLAVGASSMHFLARPHLFTLLLMPVSLWMVEADRRRPSRWIWSLVPLNAVWINLHGGVFVFLACLFLVVAGSGIEEFLKGRQWNQTRRYSLLLVACGAASLLNPYGIALHFHVLEYLRSDWIKNLIQEFQAPTFRSEGQLQYEALLILGLLVAGFLLKQGRVTEALWIVFLAHCSLLSVRHAPIYAGVCAPLIAEAITGWWQTAIEHAKRNSVGRIVYELGMDVLPGFQRSSLWPGLLVAALMFVNAPLKWPADFPAEAFPVAMVRDHAALLQSGRLLTTDQWADYIIYRFYPRQKVFVDGRSDFYGEHLGDQYVRLLQGAYDWQTILRRHRFEVALLPVNWPLAEMLKMDRSWQVVQDDSRAILFRRVGPAGGWK